MDAIQRDVARHAARITDAMGDSGLALRKPGFRVSDAFQRDLSIYDQYDEQVSRLWENPPRGAGSSAPRGEREGLLGQRLSRSLENDRWRTGLRA